MCSVPYVLYQVEEKFTAAIQSQRPGKFCHIGEENETVQWTLYYIQSWSVR